MRIRIAIPDEHVTPEVIDPVLEAVTRLNDHMLQTGQTPTSHELIRGGAVWRPENMGDEHFDHGGTIAQRGWGDCDDWAPLHAATLRTTGEDPGAIARVVKSGPQTFHAIVQRSDGTIDDPSVAAGMKPLSGRPAVIGSDGTIDVVACDPHDGRYYQGSLAPAVAPLSLHCGLQHSIRGCTVIGYGNMYEARVDLPIVGSRLVHVRAYRRGFPRHHRRRVHGALPFALSVSHIAGNPIDALNGALCGTLMCGDAAGMTTSVDRYKVLAMQAAMAGMSPGQVHEAIIAAMHTDIAQAAAESGTDPRAHSLGLLKELAAQGHIDGYGMAVIGGYEVGNIFGDIAHAASGIVHAVKDVVAKVGPWAGMIIHGLQTIVSLIPGIGTVVSDVLATAESAFDELSAVLSGNILEGAIKVAYNYATATVPGAAAIRFILDPVVNTLLELAFHKEPVEDAIMNGVLKSVPDKPQVGPINPRSIAQTLAHLIVSHLGVKKTPPGQKPKAPPPLPAGHAIMPGQPISIPNLHPDVHAAIAAKAHAVGKATPSKLVKPVARTAVATAKATPTAAQLASLIPRPMPAVPKAVAVKPPGAAHAAMPAHPSTPAHPTAAPAPALALPPGPSRQPGMPAGASHWHCQPLPGGQWACSWK
jgi:hypothetical protein